MKQKVKNVKKQQTKGKLHVLKIKKATTFGTRSWILYKLGFIDVSNINLVAQ